MQTHGVDEIVKWDIYQEMYTERTRLKHVWSALGFKNVLEPSDLLFGRNVKHLYR